MATPPWVEQSRAAPVKEVAAELGIRKPARGGLGPCPMCDAEQRSSSDKRGPIVVSDRGWQCIACNITGDTVNMVSFHKFKKSLKECGRDQCDEVRTWFSDRGWAQRSVTGEPTSQRGAPVPPAQQQKDEEPVEPERIPEAEIRALWSTTMSVADVEEVRAFIQSRGWDCKDVVALGFVRSTAGEDVVNWPAWWPPTRAKSWRLMVPAFNAAGKLCSVHARSVSLDMPKGLPKTLWPKGFSSSGLIMADKEGLSLLRRSAKMDALIVCEGITDLISTSIHKKRSKIFSPSKIAVLSCTNGGFASLRDIDLDPNTKVFVATDEGDKDGTGDRYATEVATALYGRTRVMRLPLSRKQ
jgi:hypothetical protein